MRDGSRIRHALALGFLTLATLPGCATMRGNAVDPIHRPCTDGYAYTADGWRIGIRHLRPIHPDPEKLPVVLCHGLGLNGTFWTITDGHLANQLVARGYEVFIPDMRGSGGSQRLGTIGQAAFLPLFLQRLPQEFTQQSDRSPAQFNQTDDQRMSPTDER